MIELENEKGISWKQEQEEHEYQIQKNEMDEPSIAGSRRRVRGRPWNKKRIEQSIIQA